MESSLYNRLKYGSKVPPAPLTGRVLRTADDSREKKAMPVERAGREQQREWAGSAESSREGGRECGLRVSERGAESSREGGRRGWQRGTESSGGLCHCSVDKGEL